MQKAVDLECAKSTVAPQTTHPVRGFPSRFCIISYSFLCESFTLSSDFRIQRPLLVHHHSAGPARTPVFPDRTILRRCLTCSEHLASHSLSTLLWPTRSRRTASKRAWDMLCALYSSLPQQGRTNSYFADGVLIDQCPSDAFYFEGSRVEVTQAHLRGVVRPGAASIPLW